MEQHLSTTPFGRRGLSLAMVANQTIAKRWRENAETAVSDTPVHKWQIFRAICEGKAALGVSDRALAVLNALLTFHPETALTGQGGLVVFPSNRELGLRAHGMAPSTLGRHLHALVASGLVIRRDSPNGKRYARKGQDGEIGLAFGFDLTPLVARAEELERYAEAARAERRELALVRERITITRRDIVKMIAAGVEENVAADWPGIHSLYAGLASRIPRNGVRSELEPIAAELTDLADEIQNILESHVETRKSISNDPQFEQHKQNSKTNTPTEFEPSLQEGWGGRPQPDRQARTPLQRTYPLGMILQACPDIIDYAKQGITNWRDLLAAAEVVRTALGVSPSAWAEARATLGEEPAAIVIAAILQRGDAISSAGGYLRSLTDKAKAGKFSLGPMLMALMKGNRREKQQA
jgi:replication initiation protein RepC